MKHSVNNRRTRAFTLPELLVVIAVIIILAAILLANLLHARAEAASAACESNERALANAIEEYATDHNGSYPTSVGPVTLQTFGGAGNPYVDPTNLTDPASGMAYNYISGNGTCVGNVASFEIHDLGGHDALTLKPLPHIVPASDSIAYCAGVGIMADDSQGQAQFIQHPGGGP